MENLLVIVCNQTIKKFVCEISLKIVITPICPTVFIKTVKEAPSSLQILAGEATYV